MIPAVKSKRIEGHRGLGRERKTTKTQTKAWKMRPSMCRVQRALSSKEKAVMVSGPPRCKRRKGDHRAMSFWFWRGSWFGFGSVH